MAFTLTPSTVAIFLSSLVNPPSMPLPSWTVNLLGAGDASRYLRLITRFFVARGFVTAK